MYRTITSSRSRVRNLSLALFVVGLNTGECTASSLDFDWGYQLYGYGESYSLQDDSVLNPNNEIAELPESVANVEARFNLHLKGDGLKSHLRPVLLVQGRDPSLDQSDGNQLYLSQGTLHVSPTETFSVSTGRELLTWGPGQFRSPSNPFYFDNGRNDPNRELSGIDLARIVWTPNHDFSAWAGWVSGSGYDAPAQDPWEDTWAIKLDLREFDWSGGLALAKAKDRKLFVGLDAQWTMNDALLLYAEAAGATRSGALVSPADEAQPFRVDGESPRQESVLAGAAFTMENGQTVNLEYLHYGFGYRRDEEAAYFERAAAADSLPPPQRDQTLGLALTTAPPLLGQHYLYLMWQNNVFTEGLYWRLMASRNLDDSSGQLAGYGEYPLTGRLVLFGLWFINTGGPRHEAEALINHAVNLGIRAAFP